MENGRMGEITNNRKIYAAAHGVVAYNRLGLRAMI